MSAALRRSAVLLWVLALPAVALGFYRPFAGGGQRAATLPGALSGWRWLGEQDPRRLTPDNLRQLGTDDAVYRTYVADPPRAAAAAEPVIFTAVFHAANWKSVHPPQLCLEGSGMALVEDGEADLEIDRRVVRAGRLVAVTEVDQGPYPQGSRYVSYYVYGGVEMLTGSYGDFVWHHLPRALFRRSTEGFLLRAETFAVDEPLEAAERRCRSFLAEMIPAAREVLR